MLSESEDLSSLWDRIDVWSSSLTDNQLRVLCISCQLNLVVTESSYILECEGKANGIAELRRKKLAPIFLYISNYLLPLRRGTKHE